MDFYFFDMADKGLFVRDDAESATWTVQDFTLQCAFPYDANKKIQRGQRIGFTDEIGVFQVFEIRKVQTYEPDHYQTITCEGIAVSELTDRHFQGQEFTNVSPSSIVTTLLTDTGWSVGVVTATNLSSLNVSMGSVWEDVRAVEKNWNVWITPRITYNASGITGRYLDIAPATGVFRGIRLSLEKNADEVGVTIDDSETVTALYGYGKTQGTGTSATPLTFANVVWTATGGHPAKPSGQTYLEDPTATANYGRNGQPRFGFYQNGDINDATVLLEKTWETLQTTNKPKVTVDCRVSDLYRLGYKDQPIQLHDIAMVDIAETDTHLQLTIINLTVDLIDPTATRPTIGDYIPNIIYIDRQNGGGGGGRASGRRGIEQPKNWTTVFGEWTNDIEKLYDKTAINSLAANETLYSRSVDNANDIGTLNTKTGVASLGTGETLYGRTATNASNISDVSEKVGSVPSGQNLYNLHTTNAGNISTNTTDIGTLTTKTGISSLGSGETLYGRTATNASNISDVSGKVGSVPSGSNLYNLHQTNANNISSITSRVATLESNTSEISKSGDDTLITHLNVTSSFQLGNNMGSWQSQYVLTSLTITMPSITLSVKSNVVTHISGAWDWDHLTAITNAQVVTGYTAGSVTGPSGKTIYYLGYVPNQAS